MTQLGDSRRARIDPGIQDQGIETTGLLHVELCNEKKREGKEEEDWM